MISKSPDSAEKSGYEWYSFIRKIVLVLLPTLILYPGLEVLAWETGESIPMSMIARWQSMGANRIWRGGDGRSYQTYKLARIAEMKPDIVFLGASRGNSFTHEDFAPYSFYNAAVCGWTFDHYLRFVQHMTENDYAPKVLIFNLDYWMFSADFDKVWADRYYDKPESHFAAIKMVLDYTISSIDLPWMPKKTRPPVFPGMPDPNYKIWDRLSTIDKAQGLYAVLTGDGFRQDGALLIDETKLPSSFMADPSRLDHDSITLGIPPAEGGDAMAATQIEAFEKFATYAYQRNILLIGVQLPFYDKITRGFDTFPHAGIWHEFRSSARKDYFAAHHVLFYDYADLPEYRHRPEMFLDTVHPTLLTTTQIINRIRSEPMTRASFVAKGMADPLPKAHD